MGIFSYNFYMILAGTALLGFASGLIGAFLVVRRTALIGDVITHAMVPGVAVALLYLTLIGTSDSGISHFAFLFLGGIVSGALGLLALFSIKKHTRLKNDAALAIVLGVFFGVGVSILGLVQQVGGEYVAGVETYLYGSATSIQRNDVILSAGMSLFLILSIFLFYRPFLLMSFDPGYAKQKGFRAGMYESLYYGLVLLVCMLGVRVLGVLLMLALLLVPAASMRFWTQSFKVMLWGASLLGAFSAILGTISSAYFEGMPSGPLIVICAVMIFFISFLFAPARGFFWLKISRQKQNRKIEKEHLLRFWFEYLEKRNGKTLKHDYMREECLTSVEILRWEDSSSKKLLKMLERLVSEGLLVKRGEDRFSLSDIGVMEAERVVRQHRLWEMFLLKHADIAPSMIDRSADRIEHVIDQKIVRELERLLAEEDALQVIDSPHPLI